MTPSQYLGILAAGAIGWVACTTSIGGRDENRPPDDDPIIGASAGGQTNVISDGWELASIHGGNNVKMMNFAQMQSEVLRTTGVNYSQWEKNRSVFGGADYKSSFSEDRIPTTTKILTWRKIAFEVCGEMVKKETAAPALFSSIAPTAAISGDDPKVVAQVTALFTKFFFEPPTAKELDVSTAALAKTVNAGGSPSDAWRNLCVAYLSSMRFLTY